MRWSAPKGEVMKRFGELILMGLAAVAAVVAFVVVMAVSLIFTAAPYALAILAVLWLIGAI